MGPITTFVYIWRHSPSYKFYVGSHKGTTTDGYITSSDIINESIKRDRDDWVREIIAQGNEQEMRDLETELLKELYLDEDCLNQSYGAGVPIKLKAGIKPKDTTEYSKEVKYLQELLR